MNYLISICIPTYNRANELDECLNSIFSQIDSNELKNNIVVEVFDDCSSDNTTSIVNNYKNNYSNILFHTNKENIGMDKNFQKMFYESKARFIFTLGDDDVLLPGALEYIYTFIRNHEKASIIYMNTKSFYGNYSYNNLSSERLALNEDLINISKDTLLQTLGIWITLLSGVIINRDNLIQKKYSEKYVGSFFLQAHIFLNACRNNANIVILSYPCVGIRGENSGGYNFYYVWCYQYKKLLMETAVNVGFNSKLARKIYIDSLTSSLRSRLWIIRNNNTSFTLPNKKYLFKSTIMYPILWIKLYPLVFVPIYILRIVKKIITNKD